MPVEKAPTDELRNRVLTYLANHPEGTKLVELEEELGTARIQLANIINNLIDNHQVDKRDMLYFIT